jgi:very-short-patch-repair endonuclease
MDGLKFRRQVPRGSYVVDFLCDEAMLIVELDGSQHGERVSADPGRTPDLESLGYVVLRF